MALAERKPRITPRAERAAASVLFKSPDGARSKRIKFGFAWDLFLFTGVFGIPLFLRALPGWGAIVLALWVADLLIVRSGAWRLPAETALFGAFLALEAFLGLKGNALTARACRGRGWMPDNPRDAGVKQALARWGIADD